MKSPLHWKLRNLGVSNALRSGRLKQKGTIENFLSWTLRKLGKEKETVLGWCGLFMFEQFQNSFPEKVWKSSKIPAKIN